MSVPFTPRDDAWPLGLSPSLGNPLPRRMLALTIHRDQYGPPSRSVRLEDVPAPRLKPNEAKRVLVAILATGPNFNTNFAALGLPVPVFGKGDTASVHVPGSDALGIVVDAGPGVSAVKVGQAVILDSWTGRNIRGYETHDGFNAQFAVVDEERAVPVTGALRNHTPERLAAMLLTYGTAYRAVAERLSVRPGDSVLVMGGGKGTSFPGAQIAKSFGARVLLVGSNPELARDLIARGMADAFVDRRSIPKEAFGVIPGGNAVRGVGAPDRTVPEGRPRRERRKTGGQDLRAYRGGEFPLARLRPRSRRNARLLRSHRKGVERRVQGDVLPRRAPFRDGRPLGVDAAEAGSFPPGETFRDLRRARPPPRETGARLGSGPIREGVRGGGAGALRGGRRDRLRDAREARDRRTLQDGGAADPPPRPRRVLPPRGDAGPADAGGEPQPRIRIRLHASRAGARESALEGVRSARLAGRRRGPDRPGHAPLQHLRGAGFRRKGRLPLRGGRPSERERPLHPGLPHVRRLPGRGGGAAPVRGEDLDGPGGPRHHGSSGASLPAAEDAGRDDAEAERGRPRAGGPAGTDAGRLRGRLPGGGRPGGRSGGRGNSSMCGWRATSPWLRSPVPMR